MADRLILLPRTRTQLRDPLDHVFTADEAEDLGFRSARPSGLASRRPYLPKWLADEAVPGADGAPPGYRVVLAPGAVNAISRICRLMRRGDYSFSRLRTAALRKQLVERYGESPPESRLSLAAYRNLSPWEKSNYRLMMRTTFPDALVIGSLRALIGEAFPDSSFLPECCGYISGRGSRTAVSQVMARLRAGYDTVLRVDIQSFNDTVPQGRLLLLVSRRLREAGWGAEDIALFDLLAHRFFERVDEVIGEPGVGIGMGTNLTPLFTNVYLSQLDHFIKGENIPFTRFGDDLALFFNDEAGAQEAADRTASFVSTYLGQRINRVKATVSRLDPSQGDAGGFDFGAYHYFLRTSGTPGLRIRDATLAKIRRRIKLLTRSSPRTATACESGNGAARMAELIEKLNGLIGFHTIRRGEGKKRIHFSTRGWPAAFLNDANSEEIKRQFKELDRYIFYRLRRFALFVGMNAGDDRQFGNMMRARGRRTFMDAWFRHPRPENSLARPQPLPGPTGRTFSEKFLLDKAFPQVLNVCYTDRSVY